KEQPIRLTRAVIQLWPSLVPANSHSNSYFLLYFIPLSRCFDSSDLIDRGGVLCVFEKVLQAFSLEFYKIFNIALDNNLPIFSPL
ncbi:MAG: hypothetical protein ACJAWK_001247, partial [Candidatus Azotimanducaceae bacterium]